MGKSRHPTFYLWLSLIHRLLMKVLRTDRVSILKQLWINKVHWGLEFSPLNVSGCQAVLAKLWGLNLQRNILSGPITWSCFWFCFFVRGCCSLSLILFHLACILFLQSFLWPEDQRPKFSPEPTKLQGPHLALQLSSLLYSVYMWEKWTPYSIAYSTPVPGSVFFLRLLILLGIPSHFPPALLIL